MASTAHAGLLGKYREIVLAVAFFLVFDLAVLVLNFYTSFQITADAVNINLAGRQRMLSQRMTKAVYELQADPATLVPGSATVDELRSASRLFDATLNAFERGGEVSGGNNQPVRLAPLPEGDARAVLQEARDLWGPYLAALQPLVADSPDPAQLAEAVTHARIANLPLLGAMNRLTSALEQEANAKADRLRLVQTIGIVLALINFAFILLKFIRKLRESDRRTEAAQQETSEILQTVKDGLFLLDREGRLGSQHSASLPRILRREVGAGTEFLPLLKDMVDEATFATARDYITLIFGDRVMENLVSSLNPLTEVQVRSEDGSERHLSFHFNRVREAGRTLHLLVTVADVSERVQLARALEESRTQGRVELDILLKLLRVDPPALQQFMGHAERCLLDINDRLRAVPDDEAGQRKMMQAVFRGIHGLKGDAAMLGLEQFETLAHDFELALAPAREAGRLSGDDLLALAVRLDGFFERLSMVRDLVARLAGFSAAAGQGAPDEFAARLQSLAERIARDHAKEVRVETRLAGFAELPAPLQSSLREIAVQLLRNAVAHGIETPAERQEQAKPASGHILVACERAEDAWEFVLRDDGRGLCAATIRQALLAAGRYSEAQLAELSEQQIVMKIFEPGVSTAAGADRHAGHGVGMDMVKEKLKAIGGQLRIVSRPALFTEFRIRFAE